MTLPQPPHEHLNNSPLTREIYRLLVGILLIGTIGFFIAGNYLDRDFFLQFSEDKELGEKTLETIEDLQRALKVSSLIILVLLISCLVYKKSIHYFIKRHMTLFQNVILLGGIVIIFIILAELSLAVIYTTVYEEHPLIYSLVPPQLNFPKEVLNSEGFRDKEFTLEKPSETTRIIALGDSYTYGSGIENYSDTYPKVLERKLNAEAHGSYEVLNFGISGIDSEREIEILKDQALDYNPDIVMVGYVINDLQNVDQNVASYEQIRLPFIGFALAGSSYLYNFVERNVNSIADNVGRKTYGAYLIDYYNSEVNREHMKQTFRELKVLAEEHDFKVVLINFPVLYAMEDYPFENTNSLVKEIALENDFEFVDLLPLYQNYSANELQVNKVNTHPNELGHELAAQHLVGVVRNIN